MDSKKSSPKYKMNVQYVGLRILSTFENIDQSNLGDSKLIKIDKNLNWSSASETGTFIPGALPAEITDDSNNYKFNKYTVCKEPDSGFKPNVNSFFESLDSSTPKSTLTQIEKENIYWRLRIRNTNGLTLAVFMKVLREAEKSGIHLEGRVNNEMRPISTKDLSLLTIAFLPGTIHIVEAVLPSPRQEMFQRMNVSMNIPTAHTIEYFLPGENVCIHHVLLWKKNGLEFILSLTGLQYGIRGTKKELIGHFEPKDEFFKRFESLESVGQILISEPASELTIAKMKQMGMVNVGNVMEQTINMVVEDIKKKKVWCFYCGKIPGVLKNCSSCKVGFYCDQNCQRSDWASHKKICKKVEEEPAQAGLDK